MKEPRYSKYYFNHLMFYYQPDCIVFPVAMHIGEGGISINCLCFGIVWYWKLQKDI